MNNGKIEEGCIARVVNSKAGNNGKYVTVGKFIGNAPLMEDCGAYIVYSPPSNKFGRDMWEVDQPMKHQGVCEGHLVNLPGDYTLPEFMLQRIDDGNLTEEELEAEEELVLISDIGEEIT